MRNCILNEHNVIYWPKKQVIKKTLHIWEIAYWLNTKWYFEIKKQVISLKTLHTWEIAYWLNTKWYFDLKK